MLRGGRDWGRFLSPWLQIPLLLTVFNVMAFWPLTCEIASCQARNVNCFSVFHKILLRTKEFRCHSFTVRILHDNADSHLPILNARADKHYHRCRIRCCCYYYGIRVMRAWRSQVIDPFSLTDKRLVTTSSLSTWWRVTCPAQLRHQHRLIAMRRCYPLYAKQALLDSK